MDFPCGGRIRPCPAQNLLGAFASHRQVPEAHRPTNVAQRPRSPHSFNPDSSEHAMANWQPPTFKPGGQRVLTNSRPALAAIAG